MTVVIHSLKNDNNRAVTTPPHKINIKEYWKMKLNVKKFIKNVSALMSLGFCVWIFISIFDIGIAKSMYGNGELLSTNIITVSHRAFIHFFDVMDGIVCIK